MITPGLQKEPRKNLRDMASKKITENMEGSLVATHPQIAVAFTFLLAVSMYLFFKVMYLSHSMDTLYICDRFNSQRIFELEVEVNDQRKKITENTAMSQATTTEELSQFKKDYKLVDEYFGPYSIQPDYGAAILAQLLKAEERNKNLTTELEKWSEIVRRIFPEEQNVTSGPDVRGDVEERNLDS